MKKKKIDLGVTTPKKRPETPSKIPPNHAAFLSSAAASAPPKGFSLHLNSNLRPKNECKIQPFFFKFFLID